MESYSFLENIRDFFWQILLPTKCLGCGLKNEMICPLCLSKINYSDKVTDKDIIGLFDYQNPLMKKIIWELKYHHRHYLGQKLGQVLYQALLEDLSELETFSRGQPIIIIPVPISKRRFHYRGYNQAESIARGFCRAGGFLFQRKIIYKKLENRPQAKITSRSRRLKNIIGVFGLKNKDLVKNKTIIVIDDVTTTGGTLNEIMKILKQAGAKKVIGLAVAH